MIKVWAVLLSASLLGCAATGTVAPKSLDESLAYAEGQVTGLEQSAATAVASKAISPAAGQQVLTYGDQVVAAIAAARVAENSADLTTAQAKLALATSLLSQLALYLQTQGVK